MLNSEELNFESIRVVVENLLLKVKCLDRQILFSDLKIVNLQQKEDLVLVGSSKNLVLAKKPAFSNFYADSF